MCPKSKTLNVTKLNNANFYKTKNLNMTKFKNSTKQNKPKM